VLANECALSASSRSTSVDIGAEHTSRRHSLGQSFGWELEKIERHTGDFEE
jgi:hypothetical protein